MSRRSRSLHRSSAPNFWPANVVCGLFLLRAHALALSLAFVVVGCSGQVQGSGDPSTQETGGAGGETSSGGNTAGGGVPGTGGSAVAKGGAGARGGSTSAGTGASVGAGGQSASTVACPTYQDDFLPQINTPVCGKCHGVMARIADWGVYSQAKASCGTIGSRVASGAMPPRNSGATLTTAQRSLVASWVRLGCPQTKTDLPTTCN